MLSCVYPTPDVIRPQHASFDAFLGLFKVSQWIFEVIVASCSIITSKTPSASQNDFNHNLLRWQSLSVFLWLTWRSNTSPYHWLLFYLCINVYHQLLIENKNPVQNFFSLSHTEKESLWQKLFVWFCGHQLAVLVTIKHKTSEAYFICSDLQYKTLKNSRKLIRKFQNCEFSQNFPSTL